MEDGDEGERGMERDGSERKGGGKEEGRRECE